MGYILTLTVVFAIFATPALIVSFFIGVAQRVRRLEKELQELKGKKAVRRARTRTA